VPKEFLLNVPKLNAYAKTLQNGADLGVYSLLIEPANSFRDVELQAKSNLVDLSRQRYCLRKQDLSKKLEKWMS
jgi:hypothetical protein